MKNLGLPVLILLMSIIYIFIIPEEPQAIKILFKLIPMWLIIAYAYIHRQKSRTDWIIIIGLFFCMLGDGLLIWFVVGLTAFLIGHLFYMAGFFRQWQFSKIRFSMILPIAIYSFFIGRELVSALNQDGHEALIIPVLFYIVVISLMAWSAIMTGNKWVISGSLLFVVSDSALSWNMFISTIPSSEIIIMTTYYSAQLLIAHSIKSLTVNN